VSQSAFAVVLAAVFGLVIGSFLNVVIWRVPRGESVVRPASHCPNCDREIRGRDNIPVLSWLVLRGKCRDCGSPISARYPAVEALTAAIFVLLALRFGWDLQLIAFCYLAAIGIALSAIDFDTRRLPDVIVLPSYGVGLVLLLLPAVFDHKWHNLITGVLGAVALFGFYFVTWFIFPRGMGFGDVKLAGVLGLYLGWLGWGTLIVGAFLGFLVGALAGVLLIALSRAGRRSAIPFGPAMFVGTLLGVLLGHSLSHWYLSILGA
jgi:leader peptidase (prepilin peptidase)/N-methyltransferase